MYKIVILLARGVYPNYRTTVERFEKITDAQTKVEDWMTHAGIWVNEWEYLPIKSIRLFTIEECSDVQT